MVEPVTHQEHAVEVKGSVVRAVVLTLGSHGLREAVLARVTPAAAELVRDPPLPTMWVDARPHNEIYQALLEVVGAERLRALNREAVERDVSPLLRGAAMRVLRIFGMSPATLLSKLDRVSGTTARGVIYRYTPIDGASGWFEVDYPTVQTVPLGAFVATGGALTLVFEMCGVKGTFGEPEWVANGQRNRARFAVAWEE